MWLYRTLCVVSLAVFVTGCADTTTAFISQLPDGVHRIWIGPDYYANRLMDWQLNDGRIECLEGRSTKPMRTLHLLTRSLAEMSGTLKMTVHTGPISKGNGLNENTWSGFLLGAGGAHVDFRISALAHHWPAEDGGLIVALDGMGNIVVRDNTNADAPKGPAPNMTAADWPLIPPVLKDGGGTITSSATLTLEAIPDGNEYTLDVSAHNAQTGDLIGSARYQGIAPQFLSGNVALVSHYSPTPDGPGYWFKDWEINGSKVLRHDERAFGPVMGTQYTLHDGTLKLTAQMGALGEADNRTAYLDVLSGSNWERVATADLVRDSYTVPFRVEDFPYANDATYRVGYDLRSHKDESTTHYYEGIIRQVHDDADEFVLASLNCQNLSKGRDLVWNHTTIWYPHGELTKAVAQHDPDLLFFAGDQIYESGLAGIIREPVDKAIIDYLYHWYRFVWAFRDLMRDRPTVTIPDDHDVYHGNIWGDGGIRAIGPMQPLSDNGGYIMDPHFVNAVHRTQVSHLPDPYDPTPIQQDITVYYTDLNIGGISFAVIADRMWKSTPRKVLPEADVWNGWPKNPDFDATRITEATLLGPRQLGFLDEWAHDWTGGTWMKVMLSQTLFSNLATLPAGYDDDRIVPRMRYAEPGEYVVDDHLGTDMDSNGWPQAGRNRALRTIRKGFAFHVGGDQHLGSFVRYGIDEFNDGPNAFISPAIANIWPRRWFPPEPGTNRTPGDPPYTGEHYDGFGNRMTVVAVANPVRSGKQPEALYDRVPGYGIIRFNKKKRTITAEAWPRWEDPDDPDAKQYPGWPVTVDQESNYGREAAGHLPLLSVTGISDPVLSVRDEKTGETLYTLRIQGQSFRPMVFDAQSTYTVTIGEPDAETMQTVHALRVTGDDTETLQVTF